MTTKKTDIADLSKSANVLDLVRCLQNTMNGKTMEMIAAKYHVSGRTAKRYLQAVRVAGYNLESKTHGLSRKKVYWIEDENN